MTAEAAAAAIAILRDAYPRQEFPDASVVFYARKLRDIDGAELVAAVDRITNRSTFLPSVAEIRLEVARARLRLPDVAEAWEIAMRGSLRAAPEPVRLATEYVGGRWAIMQSTNPVALRAQFRDVYERLRDKAEAAEAGALPPELPKPKPAELTSGDPLPERLLPSPVLRRELRRLAGNPVEPPTEEEMRDAIAILRVGAFADDPTEDNLYRAAELVLVHADEAIKEAT